MKYLIVIIALIIAKGKDLICHLSTCPDIRKGNNKCDSECMTSYCNFDSLLSTDSKINKESSDCYESCINLDGCDPELLGDGKCDSSCNTENCGFDWGDCTCAPGCLDSMLGDGKCDEACDNWDCDLDNHDCGQCADGCFPSMLGNGVCDPECNNEDCLYDYKDCQCADGCLAAEYGNCKPECMVLSCNYDKVAQYPNIWCQNSSLAIFSSYQQIIRNDFSYVVNLEDCYKASKYSCTLEKAFNFSNCYEECNLLECNLANGNCFYEFDMVCTRYYNISDYLCLTCSADVIPNTVWSNGGYCTQDYNSSILLPDGSNAIISSNDNSSLSNPHVYFVRSDSNADFSSGDGTYFSPFANIMNALYRVAYRYSIIYLLEGDDYYLYITSDYSISSSIENLLWGLTEKYIKITTLNNSIVTIRRAKVDDDPWSHVIFSFDLQYLPTFEMSNIIFNWQDTLFSCNDSSYCEYCPYVEYNSDSNSYYNDKGEPIIDFLPSAWCQEETYTRFFTLWGTNLVLKNMQFINFRTGFKALFDLNDSSNLTLLNVTFDNIKAYSQDISLIFSAVITVQDFKSNSGNIYFENGVVSRINNGYELGDPINTRGFLHAENISSIVFKNVEFRNNVVFKQTLTGLNSASLLTLTLFQALWIESCNFTYNYCDLGLINIQQENFDFSEEMDDMGVITYSKINNIYIKNSKFISNYGKEAGILSAIYEFDVQNLLIENCLFSLNGILNGPLVYFEGPSDNENNINDRNITIALDDGNIIEGKFLAKWWKIYNLSFIENYSGSNGVIEINKIVNIEWKDVNMTSNGGSPTEIMDINSIFTKYYIGDSSIYAKMEISDPPDLNCNSLSLVSNSFNFHIELLNMYENYCRYSSPSISLSNTTNVMINSSYFIGNYGTGSSGILALDDECTITIENSEFNSNKNSDSGSSGTINSYSNLLLKNCLFSNNKGPLYFAGQNLSIISSIFNSNNSTGSYGGSIHFSVLADKTKYLFLFISNTIFANNFCSAYGGAIFIDKRTPIKLILSIIAENTTFHNNKAAYGSCLYIDENVQLSSNSSIRDCQFLDNKASSSGAIVASYTYGVITFDNCAFSRNIATHSSAIDITIGENTNLNPSKIVLYSCYFQLNSGNATISLGNSKRNSTLEVSYCTFEYNVGSAFALDSGYALDKNSKFQHNYSPISGGSLNLKNSAIFQSQNAMHLNCSSNLNGGVASISLESQYFCFLCIFKNNYAESSGGAIYADSDASFYIKETIISGSSCKNKGSAIFIASSSANSTIIKSEIYSNYAYNDGTIFILSSLLSIFSSKIYNNSAQGENPSLYADDSSIELNDVSFNFQKGNQGCFIFLSASYATINNTIFSNGYSNSSGTAIHATSSNIEITSSTFSRLYSNETGGAIYFYESSSLTIKSSLFINLTSSIDSYSSSIFIEDSTFSNCASTSIFGTKLAELSVSSSNFFNNFGINGGTIYCSQCDKISVASSLFSNNFAENGGAIYMEKQGDSSDFSTCSIISSTFQSNIAGNGGAIWTNNINLNISLSNFTENYVNASKTESLLEIKDGIGGALKIAYDNYQESYYFNISSNNFSNNRASYRGGAISWDNSYPILQDNIFQNNSAFYGDNIASFPTMIILLNSSHGRSMESQVLSATKENLVLNGIASGQKNNPSLTFALVDSFYQIVATDISSQAQLLAIDNETVISGTAVAYASNGIYIFDDYAISAKPGSSAQVYIVSSAIDESKAEKLQASPNFYINITMRLCEIGEAAVGLNCEVCPEFYYNIDSSSPKCSDCPSYAICYGNYTIVPKPGYWRNDKFTDNFWKCPHSSSCLGSPDSSNISFVGYCKKGYEDNMCSSCQKEYARLFKYECQECPGTVSRIFRWLGIFLLLCFVTIVLHKTTRQFLFEPRLFLSIYIKIFWNYLQFMIIIATFNFNWPGEITKFFYIETCIDYINAQLFSFDCFIQSSCYSKYQKYLYKVLLASLTPIYLGILSLFFWIVIYMIKKKYLKDIKDDYISSFIVSLYLILPSIAKVMLNTMSCREINHGEFWLNEDLGIKCWDDKHLYLAFLLGLPAFIAWVIAVPSFCLLRLVKNKKNYREKWTALRYGFLYSEYDSKYYYWEFVVFYCKVILISCSAFLTNISINIQALITLLFLGLLYHIHNKNKPLILHHLNQVEAFAMSLWVLTLLAGLFYITSDLNTYISNFIAIFVLIINTYFILYLAYKLLLMTSLMNYLIKWIARIFHLKSRYAMNESKNNSEEMIRDYKILPIQDEKLSTTINFLNYTKSFPNLISVENVSISLEMDPLASEKSFPDN